MQFIDGGVTAPKGFTANGMLCKIKESSTKNDLALVFSEKLCNAAGVFTQNKVKAESVKLTKENIANGKAQAVIANSGNANACTGEQGAKVARKMASLAADVLGINSGDVIVYSTGVIGRQLPVEKIEKNIQFLKDGLSKEGHKEARTAIMTTDTHYKECAVQTVIGGKTVIIGAMAKGSGMIHINMGTMLSVMTTDCAISSQMLEKALRKSVAGTYNCVSIDGDTSTNDSLTILANGMAENEVITADSESYKTFAEALHEINEYLAKKIAGDGEGATALFEVTVVGADTKETAKTLAKSIVCSNLTKTAIAGHDANWGRILCAMGYSGAQFDPEKVDLFFESKAGKIQIIENGTAVDYSEEKATEILSQEEVKAVADVKMGSESATAWGCDLTHGYIDINADYRS